MTTGNSGAIPRTRDVGRFLRMFTELPLDEIARLEQLKDAEINSGQEHPRNRSDPSLPWRCRTRRRPQPRRRAHLPGAAAEGLPTFTLEAGEPVLIIDVAIALGMASSKSEARRLIDQGGVRLNDQPVKIATASVTEADLDGSGTARLTVGKKRHGLIKRA